MSQEFLSTESIVGDDIVASYYEAFHMFRKKEGSLKLS